MKVLNTILIVALVLALSAVTYLYLNPKIKEVYIKVKPNPEVITSIAQNGVKVSVAKNESVADHMTETLSEKTIRYYEDSLKPALNEALGYKAKVDELTKINMELKGQLTKANIVSDTLNKNVTKWKTKYIEIATNTENGTADYKYNADLYLATIFSKNKQYFDVVASSPDSLMTINGVEKYVKREKFPKEWFEWTIEASGGKDLQNNIYNARLRTDLLFFPQGKFRPFIYGSGGVYDVKNDMLSNYLNRSFLEAGVGVKYKIISK